MSIYAQIARAVLVLLGGLFLFVTLFFTVAGLFPESTVWLLSPVPVGIYILFILDRNPKLIFIWYILGFLYLVLGLFRMIPTIPFGTLLVERFSYAFDFLYEYDFFYALFNFSTLVYIDIVVVTAIIWIATYIIHREIRASKSILPSNNQLPQ
jgi:hypothetical protein